MKEKEMYTFVAISTFNEDYYVEKNTRKVKKKEEERSLRGMKGHIDGRKNEE